MVSAFAPKVGSHGFDPIAFTTSNRPLGPRKSNRYPVLLTREVKGGRGVVLTIYPICLLNG